MGAIDKTSTATLEKSPAKGGWTDVFMPGSGGPAARRLSRRRLGSAHGRLD
jgi:hypothetical protein